MRAVRVFGKDDLRLVDMEMPEPGFGEVLCKVKCCGICGTDYSILKGAFSDYISYPMTLGHEWSGVVEKCGEGVQGFQAGDPVAGDTLVSCGVCYECLTGRYYNCRKARSVGTLNTWDGTYSEYVIFPARHLFKLEGVDFDNGALLEPTATAMLSVVNAGVKLGDNVVVHGTGAIGIACAVIAKLSGAAKVVITGRKDFKLSIAKQMGADYTINTINTDMVEAVNEIFNGEGADAVIEASGSEKLLKDSLKIVAYKGKISVVSFYEKAVPLNIDGMVFRDASIISVGGNLNMNKPTLRLMREGRLDMRPVITERFRLEDVTTVLPGMKNNNEYKIKTVIEF